ncbi:jg22748 [Pararge aegeria aegeria]|uniref:Jg22748 protein n=1 Tax=Pararge aegeria aegeria TaxID=348720 RepID=A0A8S4RS64_9NEOP|nr:jg22748 [Pararge aegeria aegeria]
MLDHTTLSVVIGLRLGASIIQPHRCHCGDSVDTYGHHGLSCSRSAGRFSRHSTINDIIRRSLATAHVPAVLEPIGLAQSDGKRSDELEAGKVTCIGCNLCRYPSCITHPGHLVNGGCDCYQCRAGKEA